MAPSWPGKARKAPGASAGPKKVALRNRKAKAQPTTSSGLFVSLTRYFRPKAVPWPKHEFWPFLGLARQEGLPGTSLGLALARQEGLPGTSLELDIQEGLRMLTSCSHRYRSNSEARPKQSSSFLTRVVLDRVT